jgi:pimeloyl-ACP methyl ester carboxylesterase
MTITASPPAGGPVPGGQNAGHAGDSPPGTGGRPFPHVPGVTHRFVEVRGVRLHVAEAGAGDPVVLLHSFPQHWYAWRHVVPLLSGQYRLICPDWRGFGWSEAPQRGYDTASRAADILGLMDALGLPRVRLIAHDWGARAAFTAALQAPERISHLLAVNAAHPWLRQRLLFPQLWAVLVYGIAGVPGDRAAGAAQLAGRDPVPAASRGGRPGRVAARRDRGLG